MAKKESTEKKSREASKPPGLVSEFKQVRPESMRAAIVETAGKSGGATIDAVLEASGIADRKSLMSHLFCLRRDAGYGYNLSGDRVTITFPGNRTWRDAIRPAAEKKKEPVKAKKAA